MSRDVYKEFKYIAKFLPDQITDLTDFTCDFSVRTKDTWVDLDWFVLWWC